MANPFDMFGTDARKEQEGAILNYSDAFWIRIARAAPSNDRFKRSFTERTKPHRRAMQAESLPYDVTNRLMIEVYADSVVLGWGTGVHPAGDGLLPNKDGGDPIPFTRDNVVKVFTDLPDLFGDVMQQAQRAELFRAAEAEADAKNS